jgi:hypothetical protein
MKQYPITLSILTWRAPVTLQRTLASLQGILPLFSERLVICQESDPAELACARQMGFKPIPIRENIGIQNGLKRAASEAQNDRVLVLENDAEYVGGEAGIRILHEAMEQMMTTSVDHIRLGRLDATPSKRYSNYWGTQSRPHRTVIGYLQWHLANTRKYEMLSLPDMNPDDIPREFTRVSDSFWQTTSKYVGWTNRSFLTQKSFFLDCLLPFAEAHPTSRLINGCPDLEHPINCLQNRHWWRSQNFSIGIVKPGLFGHVRHDRNPDDEKRG